MSKLSEQNVHASNSLIIKIRGKEVGRANGVDLNADFGTQPVPEGIGSIMPAEHIALELRSDVTINSFFIRRRTTKGGAGVQDVLGCPVNDLILQTETFQLFVQDKVTGELVLAADDCTWASVSFSIRQGAITGKDARASAVRIRQASQYEPPTV